MFLIHLCRRRRRRRLCDETRDTKTWSKEKDGDGRMSAYQCLPAEPTDRPTDQEEKNCSKKKGASTVSLQRKRKQTKKEEEEEEEEDKPKEWSFSARQALTRPSHTIYSLYVCLYAAAP